MQMDIVYMSGKAGGFENAVNITAAYLIARNIRVRYVQMLSSGVDWSVQGAAFCCLDLDREVFDYEEARKQYASLLSETAEKPDLILATGWPNMVYIAKGAAVDLGLSVPVAAWLHGDIDYYRESGCGTTDVLQYADICFAINNRIADTILERYPDKPVYRINNTVDLSHVRESEDRNHLQLAYVGRLSDEKAVPFLLYGVARAKDAWQVQIVGDGPDEAELRKLAKKLGIQDRVRFRGWQENPWEHLTQCRAMVMTSLYEGAPLSVIEAFACGMQVVSTPAGFLPEIVEEGKNGYLYPFGNPDALAAVLDKMAAKPYTAETARVCRGSVTPFLPENTLHDVWCKFLASAKQKALPQRYGNGNTHLFVRDRVSVMVDADAFSQEDFRRVLSSLEQQTLDPAYIETVRTGPAGTDTAGNAVPYATGTFRYVPQAPLPKNSLSDYYLEQICKQDYYDRVKREAKETADEPAVV